MLHPVSINAAVHLELTLCPVSVFVTDNNILYTAQ